MSAGAPGPSADDLRLARAMEARGYTCAAALVLGRGVDARDALLAYAGQRVGDAPLRAAIRSWRVAPSRFDFHLRAHEALVALEAQEARLKESAAARRTTGKRR